tara:strand:+ start:3719 stop:4051 length:333 start_codon:yes stop_codon:yes gene_type:complete
MGLVKKITDFFYPRDFKGDPYGWLTNQLSHTFGSLLACLFIPWWIVGLFWVIWEIRHLIKTANWKDFYEDLYFELSGLAFWYFLILDQTYLIYYTALYCTIVVLLLSKKL